MTTLSKTEVWSGRKEESMILEKQLAVSATNNRKSITLAEVQKQSRLLGQSRDVVKDPGISHLSTPLLIALASVSGQLSSTLWDGCQQSSYMPPCSHPAGEYGLLRARKQGATFKRRHQTMIDTHWILFPILEPTGIFLPTRAFIHKFWLG